MHLSLFFFEEEEEFEELIPNRHKLIPQTHLPIQNVVSAVVKLFTWLQFQRTIKFAKRPQAGVLYKTSGGKVGSLRRLSYFMLH